MGKQYFKGALTVGHFTALPLSMFEWRITTTRLPGWSMLVQCSESEVSHLLCKAQAEYRNLGQEESK